MTSSARRKVKNGEVARVANSLHLLNYCLSQQMGEQQLLLGTYPAS